MKRMALLTMLGLAVMGGLAHGRFRWDAQAAARDGLTTFASALDDRGHLGECRVEHYHASCPATTAGPTICKFTVLVSHKGGNDYWRARRVHCRPAKPAGLEARRLPGRLRPPPTPPRY